MAFLESPIGIGLYFRHSPRELGEQCLPSKEQRQSIYKGWASSSADLGEELFQRHVVLLGPGNSESRVLEYVLVLALVLVLGRQVCLQCS